MVRKRKKQINVYINKKASVCAHENLDNIVITEIIAGKIYARQTLCRFTDYLIERRIGGQLKSS